MLGGKRWMGLPSSTVSYPNAPGAPPVSSATSFFVHGKAEPFVGTYDYDRSSKLSDAKLAGHVVHNQTLYSQAARRRLLP